MVSGDRQASVAEAFAAVPREGFLRRQDRRRAEHDGPIGIGHDQTIAVANQASGDVRRLLRAFLEGYA